MPGSTNDWTKRREKAKSGEADGETFIAEKLARVICPSVMPLLTNFATNSILLILLPT
jgi:hypothetical protein